MNVNIQNASVEDSKDIAEMKSLVRIIKNLEREIQEYEQTGYCKYVSMDSKYFQLERAKKALFHAARYSKDIESPNANDDLENIADFVKEQLKMSEYEIS